MINLLKIEWLKIKNYTAFKVMAIFFAIGVFVVNYITFLIMREILDKVPAGKLLGFSPYNFDNTWQSTSYVTGFILMLPSLLLLMLFTNEFTFKTHRQNIIDGQSRQQFISVKIAMALIFAFISTLLVLLSAFIFGLASTTPFSVNGIKFVAFFFLKALSYNMIAILFSVLIKRTAFAIGIFFIYLGAENIASRLLDFLSNTIRADYGKDLGYIGDYLPMNAADGLLEFPNSPVKDMAKIIMPTNYTWLVFSLAIIYLVIFYIWSRRKFINADL